MNDRIRWCGTGPFLDDEQRATLARHVAHWRGMLRGYALWVPAQPALGPQVYGELLLLERVGVRRDSGPSATLIDALSELTTLVPQLRFAIVTDEVVFDATPMGFERRARTAADVAPMRPEGWVALEPTDDAAPAEPAALPLAAPSTIADLDGMDDDDARQQTEAVLLRVQAVRALLCVAELRDRPRSEAQQHLYDVMLMLLGLVNRSRTAPTLVLAFQGLRPQSALDETWQRSLLATIREDERTREYVEQLAELAGSTTATLALSAERRAALLAAEADDVAHARQLAEQLPTWLESNRERIDELTED